MQLVIRLAYLHSHLGHIVAHLGGGAAKRLAPLIVGDLSHLGIDAVCRHPCVVPGHRGLNGISGVLGVGRLKLDGRGRSVHRAYLRAVAAGGHVPALAVLGVGPLVAVVGRDHHVIKEHVALTIKIAPSVILSIGPEAYPHVLRARLLGQGNLDRLPARPLWFLVSLLMADVEGVQLFPLALLAHAVLDVKTLTETNPRLGVVLEAQHGVGLVGEIHCRRCERAAAATRAKEYGVRARECLLLVVLEIIVPVPIVRPICNFHDSAVIAFRNPTIR